MNRQEVIAMIKRNRNPRNEAITLIADFLVTTKEKAKKYMRRNLGMFNGLANLCELDKNKNK